LARNGYSRALAKFASDATGVQTGRAMPQRPVQLREVPNPIFDDQTRPVALTEHAQRPVPSAPLSLLGRVASGHA